MHSRLLNQRLAAETSFMNASGTDEELFRGSGAFKSTLAAPQLERPASDVHIESWRWPLTRTAATYASMRPSERPQMQTEAAILPLSFGVCLRGGAKNLIARGMHRLEYTQS